MGTEMTCVEFIHQIENVDLVPTGDQSIRQEDSKTWEQLADHLDACASCRAYLDARNEQWVAKVRPLIQKLERGEKLSPDERRRIVNLPTKH